MSSAGSDRDRGGETSRRASGASQNFEGNSCFLPRKFPLLHATALGLALSLAASSAHAEDKAAILLPGSANDQSWNALGYSILKSLEPHGFKTAYSENVTDADEAEAMRDYASHGFEIVMGHSGRFVSAMEQVAPEFPKTQFIAVSGNEGKAPNVMSIDWNNAQFGCQLGVLAARMSKTHKVAGVYGLQGVPNITAQAGGFRLCATKAGAQVSIVYIKDMEDAAEAKEAALSLISQGADLITGKLNAAEAGLVQAAKEKHVFATGRGFDQTKIAPDLGAHKHPRRLARHVRLHRRSGEGRQNVRDVRAIRL